MRKRFIILSVLLGLCGVMAFALAWWWPVERPTLGRTEAAVSLGKDQAPKLAPDSAIGVGRSDADPPAAVAKSALALPRIDPLDAPGAIPGEAVVTFRTPEALAAFLDRAARLGIRVLGWDAKLRMARVQLGEGRRLEGDLREHLDDYESAGPNFVVRIPGLPLEESGTGGAPDSANGGGRVPFGSQGLESIGATGDRSRWGDGVTVAVLDSGIEAHPSLGKAEITHVDLLKDGGEMNGHGTAMASLIAGNDANVGGVTPAARLLDIRVADSNGDSNTALLASGIVRATDLGARVINISLGTTGYSQVLAEAVQYAQSHNAVVVAAAGNEQQTALVWPAGFAGVLSVGAVDAGGTQAWFSNSGEGLTLVGPGVGIVSGYSDGKVVIGSGTSQATAITSGVVAQLMSRGYSSSSIIPMLTRTAKPLNAPASAVGAGLVQLPK